MPATSELERDQACVAALRHIESLLHTGQAAEALERSGALFAAPDTPHARIADLCRLTAIAACALGLTSMAEAMWQQAAAHAHGPTDEAEALAQLALLLAETGRIVEAEPLYRQALQADPGSATAHANLGLLLQEDKRLDQAEQHMRRAVALAPRSAAAHNNLGNLLAQRGVEGEAERALRSAIAFDPVLAAAHCNLGVLLADQRRDDEAEACFRHALALRPGYPLARLDLSCLLLAQGRFTEGWALHEARHDPALPDNGIPPPNLAPSRSIPRWQGEPLAGRALLIWPEQGLGDQIQFCRYVPRLKALGAARVTLVCQAPLHALFETLPGVDAVIAAEVVDNAFRIDPSVLAPHDVWTFPLSLPRLLGTDLATLPHATLPYLSAPRARVAAWAPRLAAELPAGGGDLRVGLVWRGNPLHNNDAERSLPGLHTLAPLWSVPGVRFVSLQTGRADRTEAAAPEAPSLPTRRVPQPMLQLGAALHDFADTAAVLEAIDLLICVDTSIAHLAGALGRPCWVLLPQRKTDWRWLRERDDSPWYPRGMRLFRQAERGVWAPVIAQVRAALAALAANPSARNRT